MGSDEPILLYANNAADYSLLAWRAESSTKSNYLAVPGQDRRRDMRLNKAATAGDPQHSIAEVLKRGGGVWTRVEQSDDQFSIVIKSARAAGYAPPNQMVVLGPGGKVDFHPVGEPMNLHSQEYALLPVDLASEQQLLRWIDGLSGLPRDLRDATLQSIVSGGLLDFNKRANGSEARSYEVPVESGFPTWLWLVLIGVLALALGAAGGYYLPGWLKPHPSPPPKSVQNGTPGEKDKGTPPTPPSEPAPSALPAELKSGIADSLRRLEESLNKSKIEKERLLAESYLGPFEGETDSGAARRNAEAWMVAKLVLLKRGLPVETNWSRASNEKVREVLEKRPKQLQPGDLEAIIDTFCYAGQNPPGMPADQKPCSSLTLQGAQQAIDALGPPPAKAATPEPKLKAEPAKTPESANPNKEQHN